MRYPPSLRRFFIPSLVVLALVIAYRAVSHLSVPHLPRHLIERYIQHRPLVRIPLPQIHQHVFPFQRPFKNHLSPALSWHYNYNAQIKSNSSNGTTTLKHLQPLLHCHGTANRFTGHIRLKTSPVFNISMTPPDSLDDTRAFFNPTIIALPPWSENQYLVVARVITAGLHQENLICEANICYTGPGSGREAWERPCSKDDSRLLTSPGGGMRCATKPLLVNVPPTPAERCEGEFEAFADIPGFHDPRLFWSGSGEPLMIANSQSRYACFGLWMIDLRAVYEPLQGILANSSHSPGSPPCSYSTFTELTRERNDRGRIEKNWMYFSPGPFEGSYVQYEIKPRKRTFAKLIGGGLTTENLTYPLEETCLESVPKGVRDLPSIYYDANNKGSWHQSSNSIKVVLCRRSEAGCRPQEENTAFLACIQRKLGNHFGLPMRYERYFILWSASPPFSMLAISRHPLLFANETASDFSQEENWDGDEWQLGEIKAGRRGRDIDAYFTYTVSVSYAFGRFKDWKPRENEKARKRKKVGLDEMQLGYLDDEVVIGIGLDDAGMGYAIARVGDLVQCMRVCPGVPGSDWGVVRSVEQEL